MGKAKLGLLVFAISCCLTSGAQNVSLITLDQLYARVGEGKDTVYLINFWATWCVPCVQEIPNFEKLSAEEKNEKLKVILINVDFKSKLKTSVIPFVRKNRIRNEVYLLDEPDPQTYIDRIDSSWSGALPASLMIRGKKTKFFEREFTYPEILSEYKKFE